MVIPAREACRAGSGLGNSCFTVSLSSTKLKLFQKHAILKNPSFHQNESYKGL